jgi:hypothetical protein
MSDLQVIQFALEKAARRHRWGRALRGLWHGLLWGAVLSLIFLAAHRLFPVPDWFVIAATLAPIPCMVAGLIAGGWRKPGLAETARWLDGRTHLEERLSTALELSKTSQETPWRDLVITDAAARTKDLDPRSLMPFHLPRATRWALLVLALVAGLGFVPEYRSRNYVQKQVDEQRIKEAGQRLTELTRRSLEKRAPALETTQKSLETVDDLGQKMTKANLTRSDALKDLASVSDKLQQQLQDLSKDPAIKNLERAARPGGGSDSQSAAGMQKQIDSLQKQLGETSNAADKLEQLKKDLEKLQQAAKGLADKSSGATEAEKRKLSDSLSAMSREAEDLGLQLPHLDEAIEALATNQTDLFMKELDASMVDLDKLREMSRTLQQLQQQAQKMGKDLAEQLANGQPELAQATLQKMIRQLQAANLSPEELKKLMEEVAKAIQPAGDYGKVAEYLKQSTQQMAAGDKSGAAQSLANAEKELAELMKQLGDAETLMAELDALKQASMCVGTGQRWGACKNPGTRPGQKLGAGVGTWADNETSWDGELTPMTDNSAFPRPDMTPRGLTEREQADNRDALKPTKVKGQFSPGGQMPSITLKGVSIKGQSQVQYQESSTAAQSEAESALSQDKVPRVYQGTVRDYFDELKK